MRLITMRRVIFPGKIHGTSMVRCCSLCARIDLVFLPLQNPKAPWQPYMCNLAVDKTYQGRGFGKQLVRLCEHVAKNHWG